jgi:hypothetical protein
MNDIDCKNYYDGERRQIVALHPVLQKMSLKPWRKLALLVLMVVLSISRTFVRAQESTNRATEKSRSWILLHRLLVSGSGSSVIQSSSRIWNVRGMINLTVDSTSSDDPVALEIINEEQSLTESFVQDIRNSDGVGKSWYQLKLVPKENDNNTGSTVNDGSVLTSVPACSVIRSNFRDEILLHLQPRTANAISITYMPFISPFAPSTCAEYNNPISTDKMKFESKISWETAVPGMVVGKPPLKDPVTQLPLQSTLKIKPPPGISWLQGAIPRKPSNTPGGNGKPGEESEKPDPFAFLKRYWYIIVPMLLLNLFSAGSNEPKSASAGPASGTISTANTVAAARFPSAAAAAAGEQVRQRRGKKD